MTPIGAAAAGWCAHLALHYTREGAHESARTLAFDRHEGPLRVLKRLYPEGPGICHHVLVHPPGGVVGGDLLEVEARLEAGTHAVITTPGATRFYRSAGETARQQATLNLAPGARLEWLPLEAIAYRGCQAVNRVQFDLAPGAEMIGWDLLALGLPASDEAFDTGRFEQHIEWPGVWLERGRIDGDDAALLDGPLGLAGHRVLASMWFAAGTALAPARRDALLDAARAACAEADAGAGAGVKAGATSPQPGVIVMRLLAHRVEPVFAALAAVRAAWRQQAWQLAPHPPRVWRT